MGYTHYWHRPLRIEPENFKSILQDFKRLAPILEEMGVKLREGDGHGEPVLTQRDIRFNGDAECHHKQSDECDGDCSNETFYFPKILKPEGGKPEKGRYFEFCKTAYKPYDLAVTVLLIIAKHYLGDKIWVTSDGEIEDWTDAIKLCQQVLKYGAEFRLSNEE